MKAIHAILTAVATAGFGFAVQAERVNAVKAIVHDAVVTQQEVEYYTAPAADELIRTFRNQPEVLQRKLAELKNENLEERLKRQLVLHDFKVGGYNLPEPILNGLVDEQIRTRYGSRDKLIKTLQAEGITYEKYRQQAREKIIIEALRGKNISQEIIVSPHRIESFYLANQDKFKVTEEVKLRMIVLNIRDTADASRVRQRAAEIRAKIKEGAAFSEMAAVNSEGRQREMGGDYGWMEKTALRKELAAAAFSLKPGEVSEVLEFENKCYLLMVEDKRAAHTKALSEVRVEVEGTLFLEERARLEKLWIEKLRKKTFVRYF